MLLPEADDQITLTDGAPGAASPAVVRRTILGTCWMLWYQGFTMSINAIAAPWIAKTFGLGGGLCVLLMPLLDHWGLSWRWLLALSATGVFSLPLLSRVLSESQRWQHAAASGATGRAAFYDVFRRRYRARTAPMLAAF